MSLELHRHGRPLSLALALLFLAASLSLADSGPGSVTGRITKEGEAVGGVTVVIHDTKLVVITEGDGRFSFSQVPPGERTLVFSLGSNSVTREVSVVGGEPLDLEVEVDWNIGAYETVTVYAASRRAEKIVDAPASVSVVSAEEIEQKAASAQLPKVLEFTPGAEITQSGLYDFNVNTRGFNSSVNRRMAVFLDGRDTAVPLLGAQEWATLTLPMDDLAGVELVRGPSAALYGANASSGVINMTSKAPRDSLGGTVRLTVGELRTMNVDLRYAGKIGKNWYYKVLGGIRLSDDFTVSRNVDVEYSRPCEDIGEADCLPIEEIPIQDKTDDIRFAGLRFDRYFAGGGMMTMEGGWAGIEGPVFQTGIGRVQLIDAQRPWARINYVMPHWTFLANYAQRDARQLLLQPDVDVPLSGNPTPMGKDLFSDTLKYSVEVQTDWEFDGGDGRVILGAAYTEEKVDSADPRTGEQTLLRQAEDANRQAVYGQVDWRANRWLKLVFAGRLDESTLHARRFSPKVSLIFNPKPDHGLRLSYNAAFQVANYTEFFLRSEVVDPPNLAILDFVACRPFGVDCGLGVTPVLALGRENLGLEDTEGWELGYTATIGRRAFVGVDYYISKNENFITDLLPQVGTSLGRINPRFGPWVGPQDAEETEITPGFTVADAVRTLSELLLPEGTELSNDLDNSTIIAAVSYTNFGEVNTQGVDARLDYFFSEAWNMSASYSWFDFEIEDATPELEQLLLPNSPEHKASLGFGFQKKRWNVSLAGRWVDTFRWSVGLFDGEVPSYTTFDLTAGYRINETVGIGLDVSNLLDDNSYQSFGGDILGRRALLNAVVYW